MKPSKSGDGVKTKKPYFLMESMQFTIPFIKALSATSGNPPDPQEQEEGVQYEENNLTPYEENLGETQCTIQ